jgi:predicted extracellular nuclease
MPKHAVKFLTALVCLLLLSGTATTQSTELYISEYIEGSSNNKAIEIFNPGSAAVNLATAGYSITMHFNGNPAAGLTINLNGSVAAGDVYVVAHSSADAAILPQADQTNGAGWFNGDDAVVLRKGGVIIDVIGQIGFDPGTEWGSGNTSTADNTLRRKGSVTSGDANGADAFDPSAEWDGFANNTFGGLGSHGVVQPPTFSTLEIFEIQGSLAASPHAGQQVRTLDNIVTALTSNGFFIQTPAARVDASDLTSNGIFVFTGSAPGVHVGDQVDVTGTVAEFFELTEITSPSVTVDSTGNAVPAPVQFGMVGPGEFLPSHDPIPLQLERYEGMLVRMENGRATAPTDRFGDVAVVADSTRAFREPGILFPGDPGHPVVWDGNPEIFEIDPDAAGLSMVQVAAGTAIALAEGPLSFAFGDYQIWPTTLTIGDAPVLPRPVRPRNPGEFTVATQNLLRFFDSNRDNGPDDGAANAAQYSDKLVKASLHIRTVLGAPDVLVVEEVENLDVVQALAAQIAADDPAIVYTAHLIEGHDIGGIDTGILTRDTVTVSSVTQIGADTMFTGDDPPSHLHDRPPLLLTAEYAGNGAPFPLTVIGVHNRSLSGIETSTRVREKRLQQALEIANAVQAMQSADPARRIVLTGDFNAFQFSDGYVDAIGIITGNLDPDGAIHPGHADVVDPNLVEHTSSLPAPERYSFVFDGSAQELDHTLTTASLSPYLRGLQMARGNADAPAAFQTDFTTPLRLSDHDAQVLYVMSDFDADALPDDVDNCATNPNPGQQDFDADGTGDSCDDDDDNDGVLDTVDACQQSAPLGMFVVVDACSTAVPDRLLTSGCSISESISRIGDASWNHGQFVSGATHLLNDLRKDGMLDNRQRSEVHRCVAWANIP